MGAKSLSEALKSNTTLAKLNLDSEDKRRKTHKRHASTIHSSIYHFKVNQIGETGAASLSDALKSNTTLTAINLRCKDRRGTRWFFFQKFIPSDSRYTILTGNNIRETGVTSLSEALKSNTTLTDVHLGCKQ